MQHLKLLPLILLFSFHLEAHEHWLQVPAGPFQSGQRIEILLRSGHSPGPSEFLLDTDLIQEAYVQDPTGGRQMLEFQAFELEHRAAFQSETTGAYTVVVKLRKRNKGPFSHFLTTRFQVGSPASGSVPIPDLDLAIVVEEGVSALHVTTMGEPAVVPVFLMEEGSPGHSLSMDKMGHCSLTGLKPGFYVAVAHYRRQTSSHALYIGD